MANQQTVRCIALALPGTREGTDRFAFSVENKGKHKGFAWAWNERVEPRKPRVPRADVLAVRVANNDEKSALLAGDPEKFFTEPHYNGFPAVLVRLPAVTAAELRKLLADAWRCQAPRHLLDGDSPAPLRRIAGTPRRTRTKRAPSKPAPSKAASSKRAKSR
jgi:hypothetical protein